MSRSETATKALRRLIVACDAFVHDPSEGEIKELALASGESVLVVTTIFEAQEERAEARTWPKREGGRWMPAEDALLRAAWRRTARASASRLADLDARLAKRLSAMAENRERGMKRTTQQVRERRNGAWWLRPI